MTRNVALAPALSRMDDENMFSPSMSMVGMNVEVLKNLGLEEGNIHACQRSFAEVPHLRTRGKSRDGTHNIVHHVVDVKSEDLQKLLFDRREDPYRKLPSFFHSDLFSDQIFKWLHPAMNRCGGVG